MPDQNFEQQARDMANGFELKPKPEVWQNVRNAIQEPRRKRRFVLWWWLLPLGLLGSGIVLYTLTEKRTEVSIAKHGTTNQTLIHKQTTLTKQQNDHQHNSEKVTGKRDSTTIILISKNNNVHHMQLSAIKTNNKTVADKKESNKEPYENIISTNKADDGGEIISRHQYQKLLTAEDKHTAISNSNLALENHAPVLPKGSMNSIVLNKNSILPIKSIKSDSSNISKSAAVNKSTSVPIKKHTSKLHWGILAEAGIAAMKSSPFILGGSDKRDEAQTPSFPNSNGTGSGTAGLPGSNGFYYSNDIQQGSAFGLGVASQRKISNSIDFFADVAYSYQSFDVTTTAYKDSLLLNNALTSFAGSYYATQRFHFATLFAGINWHFINTKGVQLGISAGADNLFLVATNQRIDNVVSSNFSLNVAMQSSNSAFAKNNYYTYQPSLFAGILINIKTGSSQLQLVPYTRSSFRPFEKNASNSNYRLFSAGLRAVYFFR